MDTQITDTTPLHVRIELELDAELRETMGREDRDKTAIVKRALREYIAKSKADAAKPNKKAERV